MLGLIEEYFASEAMQSPSVIPTSNFGVAAANVRRHCEALNRCIRDATIPIDHRDCEPLMKRVATVRKNCLIKGSLAAGERATNLLMIVGSAIRNVLDVRAYLDEVLRRVLAGEIDWTVLTIHCWKSEHSASIREYRQDERRQAADHKRTRRARRRLLNKSTGHH